MTTCRYWFASVVAAGLAFAVMSCSGKKATGPTPNSTSLRWVGTEVIYHEVAGKRDFTMLLISPTWCGWGSRLKEETLTDSTVARMLNESFNVVFLNPDADSLVVYGDTAVSCAYLAGTVYGVRGYPDMLFFKRNGELIGPAPGYRDVPSMIALLNLVIEKGSQ